MWFYVFNFVKIKLINFKILILKYFIKNKFYKKEKKVFYNNINII